MPEPNALLKLGVGRAILQDAAPYFMSTVYHFTPCETSLIPTIGVTKNLALLYNPEWVNRQTPQQIAGALAHEVMHVLNRHFDRLIGGMQAELWNTAGDLAINPAILKSGLVLPDNILLPKEYDFEEGLAAETYYNLLVKRQQTLKLPGIGRGSCGGAAGNPLPSGLEDKINQTHGRPRAEVDHVVRELRRQVQAVGRSNPGSLAGSWEEDVEADDGKLPWREVLQRHMSRSIGRITAGSGDYSLKRPSRRSMIYGSLRPGSVRRAAEIAAIVDTSASMHLKRLQAALGECAAAVRASGTPYVWLLEADTDVAIEPRRVSLGGLQAVTLHGRGGTCFDPALQRLETLRPRPQLAAYFTDGEGRATYRPSGITIIWIVIGGNTSYLERDDWSNIVVVDED